MSTPGGAAIAHFRDGYNQRAQPFVETKTAGPVLAKPIRNKTLSETLH